MSLVFDTTARETWEIMADLHIRLAYPRVSEKRRLDLTRSTCADQVTALIEKYPDRRQDILARFPLYSPAIRTERKHIVENLETAQKMGAVVLVRIKETATGKPPIFEGTKRAISQDFAIRHLWPRGGDEEEWQWIDRLHEVERDQIRPRYPVAHLAAALQLMARMRTGDDVEFIYEDARFLGEWLTIAEQIAGQIRATPQLANMASQLLDARLAGPPLGSREPFLRLNEPALL